MPLKLFVQPTVLRAIIFTVASVVLLRRERFDVYLAHIKV